MNSSIDNSILSEKNEQSLNSNSMKMSEIYENIETNDIDPAIARISSYWKIFKKFRLPYFSKVLDICSLFNFRLYNDNKYNANQIGSLVFFMQSMKTSKKTMNYERIINCLYVSKHDEEEFRYYFKLFSTILGFIYEDKVIDEIRKIYEQNQAETVQKRTNNDEFPNSYKDLENEVKSIFNQNADLNYILNEYDEILSIIKYSVFNAHKYLAKTLIFNYNVIIGLIKENKFSKLITQSKPFSYIEKVRQFPIKDYVYNYMPNINQYVINIYNFIIQPVKNMEITVSEKYCKIKTNITNYTNKNEFIQNILDHCQKAKMKFTEIKIYLNEKENNLIIIIKERFSLIANHPWMLAFIEKINYFNNLQIVVNAKNTINNVYLKWLKRSSIKQINNITTELPLIENKKEIDNENLETKNNIKNEDTNTNDSYSPLKVPIPEYNIDNIENNNYEINPSVEEPHKDDE